MNLSSANQSGYTDRRQRITSAPGYTATPFAWLIEDWNAGGQMICGKVTATSPTGCTVQGMISQGTLVLNAAPFTTAPSGTVVTVAVIA